MTKSARILKMYASGVSVGDIAAAVGCLESYVRVVARQRRGSVSDIDRRYRAANIERLREYDRKRDRRKKPAAVRETSEAAR